MDIFFLQNLHRPLLFIILTILFIFSIVILSLARKNTNFVNTQLLKRVYQTNTIWQSIFYGSIGLITFTSIIIISGPYTLWEKQVVKKEGIDIQIVLDMSYSMIAEDIIPTRIQAAKNMLTEFVGEIYSDRVGVILFSGKPFQSVPLTFDYEFLQDFLQSVSVDIVNQSVNDELAGTSLWDGLVLASDILNRDYPEREKVIILITDGEANKWVKPDLALRLLKDQWIKTYTIGVWKLEETTITIPRGNFFQEMRIWWIDEEILQKISLETWGKYFKADSSNSLKQILDTIALLEKTPLEYETYTNPKSQNILPLFFILFLLCVLSYLYFFKSIRI